MSSENIYFFRKFLINYRESQNLSQDAVAALMGEKYNVMDISRIENNSNQDISADFIFDFMRTFNFSIEDIFPKQNQSKEWDFLKNTLLHLYAGQGIQVMTALEEEKKPFIPTVGLFGLSNKDKIDFLKHLLYKYVNIESSFINPKIPTIIVAKGNETDFPKKNVNIITATPEIVQNNSFDLDDALSMVSFIIFPETVFTESGIEMDLIKNIDLALYFTKGPNPLHSKKDIENFFKVRNQMIKTREHDFLENFYLIITNYKLIKMLDEYNNKKKINTSDYQQIIKILPALDILKSENILFFEETMPKSNEPLYEEIVRIIGNIGVYSKKNPLKTPEPQEPEEKVLKTPELQKLKDKLKTAINATLKNQLGEEAIKKYTSKFTDKDTNIIKVTKLLLLLLEAKLHGDVIQALNQLVEEESWDFYLSYGQEILEEKIANVTNANKPRAKTLTKRLLTEETENQYREMLENITLPPEPSEGDN